MMSTRQREILLLLRQYQAGLSIPKLELSLGISRTAVNQHLTNMERDGLVSKGEAEKTGGRPGHAYVITEKGIEQLPKQYSWFSELMLDGLKAKLGSDGLTSFLRELAKDVGRQLRPRLGGKANEEQLNEVNSILNELGYDAHVPFPVAGELPMIVAHNCVYHKLAAKHPEICQFDLALLETLLEGHTTSQTECMVQGGAACRFCFHTSAIGE
ncbi:MAG: helix-turn-helix transcriptional regulator [Nitrospirales bacterium]